MREPISSMERLLQEYMRTPRDRSYQISHLDLIAEALRRLNQMRRLVYWIIELENEYNDIQHGWFLDSTTPRTPSPSEEIQQKILHNGDEMWLHCETFYYIANRFFLALDGLPGLLGCRTQTIQYVRNQLIEHPSPTQGVTVQCFGRGDGRNGPILKPVLAVDGQQKKIKDNGLYANLDEMAEVMCRRLSEVLGKEFPATT